MVDLIARQLFSPNFNNENFFKFLKKKLSRRITPFIFFGASGVTKKSAAAAFGGGVHHWYGHMMNLEIMSAIFEIHPAFSF